MSNKKIPRNCSTCAYFSQHYIKMSENTYCAINCGCCMCEKLKPEDRLTYDYYKGCDNWEYRLKGSELKYLTGLTCKDCKLYKRKYVPECTVPSAESCAVCKTEELYRKMFGRRYSKKRQLLKKQINLCKKDVNPLSDGRDRGK